jgi:predicted unusual protein kinase regulating ubiquinone biosynthesis (AarF/ABC1/UbiB family)
MTEKGVFNFREIIEEKFFEKCPNCKQAFQGDLHYDLTKAQLSFVEREFKDVPLRSLHLGALIQRMKALDGENEVDRAEGEELSAKILPLVEDMKKKSDPSFDILELACVYQVLGGFNCEVGTKCCLEKAKQYTEKARDIIIASGM